MYDVIIKEGPTPLPATHSQSEQRLAFLDSLRGLAAIYVVLFHMMLVPSPHLAVPDWISQFVIFGRSGVTLFFVISAFSLCLTMPGSYEKPDLRTFYIRRFFRITPLFYFMIVVALARDYFCYGVRHPFLSILSSFSFLFNFTPQWHEGIVWASWTIGVEMIFYVFFPIFYKTSAKLTKIIGALLTFLIVSPVFNQVIEFASLHIPFKDRFFEFSFLHNLPVFLTGILGYYVYARRDAFHITRPVGAVLVLGAFYGFYSLLNGGLKLLFPDPLYWQGVLYTMLLVGTCACPSAILVNGFTRFLGRISYSTYLNHPIVIAALFPFYKWIYALDLSNAVKFGISAVVTITCVIPLSYGTFLLIEKPGIALGRRLIKRGVDCGNLLGSPGSPTVEVHSGSRID
jgi:peptidoglycan/LPS O-acetylase OafA/YrhL